MKIKKISLSIIFCFTFFACIFFTVAGCADSGYDVNFIVDNEVYRNVKSNGNELINMPPDPSKDGYIFAGWFFDKNTWEEPFELDSYLNEKLELNLNIYSKWDLDTYTITYFPNDGVVNGGINPTEYTIESETFSLFDASKQFYEFDGWFKSASFSGDRVTKINKGSVGNITLYAKFSVKLDGAGTSQNPYVISTKDQLLHFANLINNNDNYSSGKYFTLGNDIDLQESEWNPIGYLTISEGLLRTFQGSFDGKGYKIFNFKITQDMPQAYYFYKGNLGFFGYAHNATIKNLGVTDFSIDNTFDTIVANVGGLIGKANNSTISNSYSDGQIYIQASGNAAYVGGLIGNSVNNNLSSCYANVTVTGRGSSGAIVGGLAGFTYDGSVTNSYSVGNVSGNSFGEYVGHVGGLIGRNSGTNVSNSYATGSVTNRSQASYSGGLIGRNDNGGHISNCYATGEINSISRLNNSYVGGLIGSNEGGGNITNCYRYVSQAIYKQKNNVTSSDPDNTLGVTCTLTQLNTATFYSSTLTWSTSVWNLSGLNFTGEIYPTLK